MGLYPGGLISRIISSLVNGWAYNGGGGGFNVGFYDNFASLLTSVNDLSFKHE